MPNRSSKKKPRDLNQLAKAIVDQVTGDAPPEAPGDDGKNPAAVALGRLGGLKGGKARAIKLSAKKTRRDRQKGGSGAVEEGSRLAFLR